jgi:hypothetical protein
MKKSILALVFVALVPAVQATTVTLSSAASGPSVFRTGGTALVPNGSVILVGTLTTPNDASTFIEFGTSTVKSVGLGTGTPGKVAGSVTNITEADDAPFNNLPVYIWVYNAATLPATAAERNQIEQGLFRSDTFTFPANDPGGLGDAVTPLATSFLTPVNLSFQQIQATVNMQGDNGTGNATGGRFVLGAIPEPSVSLLAMGAAMMVGLRRRR